METDITIADIKRIIEEVKSELNVNSAEELLSFGLLNMASLLQQSEDKSLKQLFKERVEIVRKITSFAERFTKEDRETYAKKAKEEMEKSGIQCDESVIRRLKTFVETGKIPLL